MKYVFPVLFLSRLLAFISMVNLAFGIRKAPSAVLNFPPAEAPIIRRYASSPVVVVVLPPKIDGSQLDKQQVDSSPSPGIYNSFADSPWVAAASTAPAIGHGGDALDGPGEIPVVGIIVAIFFVLALVVLWWKYSVKDPAKKDSKSLDLSIGLFTFSEIRVATNNFNLENKLGEGGFGPVYKGYLPDGTIIAVKQLSSKSNQGNREFVNEIGMISTVQHPHLVKLYGWCVEAEQLLLVYEYMENNSLARALFGPKHQQLHLDWRTRHKICLGLARGLAYLHGHDSRVRMVHRDIKAANVLLDKNLIPKISDFGLAKLHEEDNTHISTRIAGTLLIH